MPSWITSYGYWTVSGAVALDVPMPGEAALIATAMLAGTTHALNIWFVVGAAAAGAILGDNVGFFIGREIGQRLVVRYGGYVGLPPCADQARPLSFLAAWRKGRVLRPLCRGSSRCCTFPSWAPIP